MDAAGPLRVARERFTRDVRHALGQVPPEIADSAVGHAVLAEALIQIASDILQRQGNPDFLRQLVGSTDRNPKSAAMEWNPV